jgi:aromatic ring-opening dioxygenase LigB subunit
MKKIRLEKFDYLLNEQLKDKEFKKLFEIERAKVASAQKRESEISISKSKGILKGISTKDLIKTRRDLQKSIKS